MDFSVFENYNKMKEKTKEFRTLTTRNSEAWSIQTSLWVIITLNQQKLLALTFKDMHAFFQIRIISLVVFNIFLTYRS